VRLIYLRQHCHVGSNVPLAAASLYLRDPARVSQEQERHVGKVSLMMHPTGELDVFAIVLGELTRHDP